MSDPDSGQSRDFNSAYGSTTPPWDIGQPQPALLALLDEFPASGPALDVGCGTGQHVFALAQRGLPVLGVDQAETAIARAKAQADSLPDEVKHLIEFQVGDALHPTALQKQFMTVVDSGFLHLFGPEERDQFVQELAGTIPNGGRYYLLGFGFDSPMPNAPRKVTESEIRERFAPERGWRILALRQAQFQLHRAPGAVPAIAACVERIR